MYNIDKNCYCGNSAEFEETTEIIVHKNIEAEYNQLESCIRYKKYDEALKLSYSLIEWMPKLPSVYWFRLLAKNKCSTARELIAKGFSCEDDVDFCNALKFSTGNEHSIFINIKKIMPQIKEKLQKELSRYVYNRKFNTGIIDIRDNIQKEIDSKKQELFSCWLNLCDIEGSLYIFEKKIDLCILEYRNSITVAAVNIEKIISEMYDECSEKAFFSFELQLGAILQQSEQAKDAIIQIKDQHPWVKSFETLVLERNQILKTINARLLDLKEYEFRIRQIIQSIEEIDEQYQKILSSLDRFNYIETKNILGAEVYNRILLAAGLV